MWSRAGGLTLHRRIGDGKQTRGRRNTAGPATLVDRPGCRICGEWRTPTWPIYIRWADQRWSSLRNHWRHRHPQIWRHGPRRLATPWTLPANRQVTRYLTTSKKVSSEITLLTSFKRWQKHNKGAKQTYKGPKMIKFCLFLLWFAVKYTFDTLCECV